MRRCGRRLIWRDLAIRRISRMQLAIFPQPRRAALSFLAAVLLCLSACQPRALHPYKEIRLLMGTRVQLTLEGDDPKQLQRAAAAAFQEMTRLSDMMNHYDPDSVVSAINRQAGRAAVPAPGELRAVLRMAEHVSTQTQGAFDITVGSLVGWRFHGESLRPPRAADIRAQLPKVNYRYVQVDEEAGTVGITRAGTRIDLGGIAKLYILNAGMEILTRHGVEHALIDGGGDFLSRGTFQGRPWRIGIRDPRQPDGVYGVLNITNGFVASSGDYERFFFYGGRRYHHILDPKTGYPAQGPRHVTLVAKELAAINGYSTALMVMGAAASRRLVEDTPALEALIIEQNGAVWTSPGLRTHLEFTP